MADYGKILLILGVFITLIGLLMIYQPFSLFRLPGDVFIRKENVTIIIPIATSLVLSLLITLLANMFRR